MHSAVLFVFANHLSAANSLAAVAVSLLIPRPDKNFKCCSISSFNTTFDEGTADTTADADIENPFSVLYAPSAPQ